MLAGRARSRAATREREKANFNIYVKLFTEEKFPLKNISSDMKVSELKQYMEFATGIPVHMQRISYLDDAEMLDHADIKSNDIVPGATLQMRVWPMWKDLIEAVAANDVEWVFNLGVTQPTDYHTPGSDYMTKRARKAWLQERAFLALFVAAHRGHEDLVRKLISAGADVNACTPLGRTPLHVAAAQGRGRIVDLLLEKGADIDAEDENGETALSIAAKFGHKTCERHLFLFRWQERAKRTHPSKEAQRMAHQFFDSDLPVWLRGNQCQLYFSNILPPGEYEGTRLDAPKKKNPEDMSELEGGGKRLPPLKVDKRRARSGPARLGKARGVSYDAWLSRKKSAEQKVIDIKKMQEENKKFEEEERKRLEAEKEQSYETWLAMKEVEQKTVPVQGKDGQVTMPTTQFADRHDGFLRNYLRSLDRRKQSASFFRFEDWLNQKEERVLGFHRTKTTA